MTAASEKQELETTPLPLFYEKPTLLRFDDHKGAGLLSNGTFGFAKAANAVPITIGEFMPIIRHYPIVFSDSEHCAPVAVLGLREGENLLVQPDGHWRAQAYIPAYIRRYPFIVTQTPDQKQQLLAVDAASDRFAADTSGVDAKAFFASDGTPTAETKSAMDFCHAYHVEHVETEGFTRALKDAKLLVSNQAALTLPDHSRYTLGGFQMVDEKAFRALRSSLLYDWHSKGWLQLIALHLASQQNWQLLMEQMGRSQEMAR